MNHYILKGCLYIVITLLLTSCASSSNSLPDWVTNTQPDTTSKLYGIGEGRSVEQAKKSALLDIAAKIEIHVQSQSSSNSVLRNGEFNESFKQQINTQVSEIKLSNHQVEKVDDFNGRFYALVSLSRTELIKNQKITFNRLNKNIDNILAKAANDHIKKLVAYNKARVLAEQATSTAIIISSLDKSFVATPYLNKFENIKQAEKNLVSKTYFHVKTTRQFSSTKKLIENALAENGFQFTEKSQANAIIQISGEIKEKYLFNTYNIRAKVIAQLKSLDNYILGGQEYDAIGSSFSSAKEARNDAFYKLISGIDSRQKVYQFLGLSEVPYE